MREVDEPARKPIDSDPFEPEGIIMTQDMFPSGSIGYCGFSPLLEGRKRPPHAIATRIDQPFFMSTQETKGGQRLRAADISTVNNVLHLTENEFYSLVLRRTRWTEGSIKQALDNLNSLTHLPHSKLLGDVFHLNRNQIVPAPIDMEKHLVVGVDKALEKLDAQPTRHHTPGLLKSLYGLDTWELHPNTAGKFGKTREWVRQKSRMQLRTLSRDQHLSELLPFIRIN